MISWLRSEFSGLPHKSALTGVVLILISVILKQNAEHFPYFGVHSAIDFTKEIGFALIIAYFIAFTIERASKKDQNSHVANQIDLIKKNVFEAIFHQKHDEKMIRFAIENLFNSKFYRRKSLIMMEISKIKRTDNISNPETPVFVHVSTKCEIHNISNSAADYPFVAFIEKPFDKALAKYVKMTRLKIGNDEYDEKQLQAADIMAEDTDDFKKYRTTVRIDPEDFKLVEANYTFVKYARDEMPWQQVDPCDGLEMRLTRPEGLSVFGIPIHKTQSAPRYPTQNNFELTIEEPLFPHNGAVVWWYPSNFGAVDK
jgi:hypothetical protein